MTANSRKSAPDERGEHRHDDSARRHAGLLDAHRGRPATHRKPHQHTTRGRGIDERIPGTAEHQADRGTRQRVGLGKEPHAKRQQRIGGEEHRLHSEAVHEPACRQCEHQHGAVVARNDDAESGMANPQRLFDRWREGDDERDRRRAQRMRDEEHRESPDASWMKNGVRVCAARLAPVLECLGHGDSRRYRHAAGGGMAVRP